MSERVGRYLEQTGNGGFRLLGEVPKGSMDAHVHLGTYLKMPILGGLNLTGTGSYGENLRFHLRELARHRTDICNEMRKGSLRAMEGLFDVPAFRTEMHGPGVQPAHLFTSVDSLFDPRFPCYMNLSVKPSIALMRDVGATTRAFPRALKEANATNLMQYLDEYGLERAVVTPVETGKYSRFSETAAAVCEEHPRAVFFFSVHPRNPDFEKKFSSYRLRGGKGVKFHPEFQGVSPDSEEAFRLFEKCLEAKLPVVCHVGGVKPGAAHSHPDRYRAAVNRFRELRFILCHVGLADRDATLQLARQCDNVFLETSGQPATGIQEAAKCVGTDRILFGSDWPLYHPAVPISCVLEAFPGDEDRERVFRNNLKAVLGEEAKPVSRDLPRTGTRRGAKTKTGSRKPRGAGRKAGTGGPTKAAGKSKAKSGAGSVRQDKGRKKKRPE